MANCKLEYGGIFKSFFTIIYSVVFQIALELVQVTAFRSFAHREEQLKQSNEVFSVLEEGFIIMSIDKNKAVLMN